MLLVLLELPVFKRDSPPSFSSAASKSSPARPSDIVPSRLNLIALFFAAEPLKYSLVAFPVLKRSRARSFA